MASCNLQNASERRQRNFVAITDVAVIVIELFVSHVQTHRSHAVDQNPRAQVEIVFVTAAAIDVTEA